MDRYLIVVSRERLDLWSDIIQRYNQTEGLEILLDRREHQPAMDEAPRRRRSKMTLAPNSFMVVPLP